MLEYVSTFERAECGILQGVHDPFGKLAGKKETPEETAARLKAESAAARNAVMCALYLYYI